MFRSLLTDMVKLDRIEQVNVDGIAQPQVRTLKAQCLCLIEERAGELRIIGQVEALRYDAVAWFMAPEDLRPRNAEAGQMDRLTVLATKGQRIDAGAAFVVVHAMPSPGRRHHIEARLVRMPPAGGEG